MSYESDIYALNDIFEQGNRNNTLLQIPEYQRNYKWGSEQVERLIKIF